MNVVLPDPAMPTQTMAVGLSPPVGALALEEAMCADLWLLEKWNVSCEQVQSNHVLVQFGSCEGRIVSRATDEVAMAKLRMAGHIGKEKI